MLNKNNNKFEYKTRINIFAVKDEMIWSTFFKAYPWQLQTRLWIRSVLGQHDLEPFRQHNRMNMAAEEVLPQLRPEWLSDAHWIQWQWANI